jgi:hypothetical protein
VWRYETLCLEVSYQTWKKAQATHEIHAIGSITWARKRRLN